MSLFRRKTVLLIILVLVLLSIAVRYPLVEHERQQTDSYFIHYLSKSISEDGYARWTVHPLSYFGYYPLSYPSGVPFLYSELSTLTGLSIEVSILLGDMLLATVFCLAVFTLIRHFVPRVEFVLLATFLVILGARFVDTTYWNGSARGTVSVLMILVVFASLRGASMYQVKMLPLAFILGFGCFAVHHMAVILVLFGFGYVLAALQAQYLMRRVRIHRRRVGVAITAGFLGLVVVISFGYFEYFSKLALMNLQQTSLFNLNPPFLSVILNMAATYVSQIGFVVVFAAFGVVNLFRESSLSVRTLFPITVIIAFVPVLANPLYVSMALSPFIAIPAVLWISKAWNSSRRRIGVILTVVLLMGSSVALTVASIDRWNGRQYSGGDTVRVPNQVFNDANYLSQMGGDGRAITNTNLMHIDLPAIGEVEFLGSGIFLLINGDVQPDELYKNVTWQGEFPTNLYIWFRYENQPDVDSYVSGLMTRGVKYVSGNPSGSPDAKNYFISHSNLMVAVDENHANRYVGMYEDSPSTFLGELRLASWDVGPGHSRDLSSYLFYSSERISLYVVHIPS